jgi:hypothetical protein
MILATLEHSSQKKMPHIPEQGQPRLGEVSMNQRHGPPVVAHPLPDAPGQKGVPHKHSVNRTAALVGVERVPLEGLHQPVGVAEEEIFGQVDAREQLLVPEVNRRALSLTN